MFDLVKRWFGTTPNAVMPAGVETAGVGTPAVGVTHGFGPFEASKDYSKPWMRPAIRDSAASAGVPSRYNVFEYGYPTHYHGTNITEVH